MANRSFTVISTRGFTDTEVISVSALKELLDASGATHIAVSQDVEIDFLAERGEVHDVMSSLLGAVTYKAPEPKTTVESLTHEVKAGTTIRGKKQVLDSKKHTVRTNGRYTSVYDTLVGLGVPKKKVARFWADMMAEFPTLRANVVSLATEQGPGRPTPMLSSRFITVLTNEFDTIAREFDAMVV